MLLPRGVCPTFAPPLIRASIACLLNFPQQRLHVTPHELAFPVRNFPAISTSRTCLGFIIVTMVPGTLFIDHVLMLRASRTMRSASLPGVSVPTLSRTRFDAAPATVLAAPPRGSVECLSLGPRRTRRRRRPLRRRNL